MAGLEKVPVRVIEADDRKVAELALLENLQREGLNPVDEAEAYQRLISEFGLTQDDVARRVGKSRASVANMLRLLKLPGEVQQWLREGRLTAGHAKALLSLADPDDMISAAREMIRGKLSVRQAESLARNVAERGPKPDSSARTDPNVRAAIMELERVLGTRVTLRERKGKGRIEVHFHSQDELERLYGGLLSARFD